jgi:hypothetical protein
MVFGLCFCWWGLVVFGVVGFFGCCCLGFLVLCVVFQVFSVLAIVRLTALTIQSPLLRRFLNVKILINQEKNVKKSRFLHSFGGHQ